MKLFIGLKAAIVQRYNDGRQLCDEDSSTLTYFSQELAAAFHYPSNHYGFLADARGNRKSDFYGWQGISAPTTLSSNTSCACAPEEYIEFCERNWPGTTVYLS